MPENGNARNLREGLLQELQPLSCQLGANPSQPSDIRAWARKTCDESRLDGINPCDHDDRDFRRQLLNSERRWRSTGNEDIYLAAQELSGNGRQPSEVAFDPSPFDRSVLT